MRYLKILNLTRNTILAEKALIADSLFSRLRGLLGRDSLGCAEALILKPCSSIHTFFMRFPIDAAFVDGENHIIKIYPCLKPWRLTAIFLNAAFCLELPNGILAATHTKEGDYIQIS